MRCVWLDKFNVYDGFSLRAKYWNQPSVPFSNCFSSRRLLLTNKKNDTRWMSGCNGPRKIQNIGPLSFLSTVCPSWVCSHWSLFGRMGTGRREPNPSFFGFLLEGHVWMVEIESIVSVGLFCRKQPMASLKDWLAHIRSSLEPPLLARLKRNSNKKWVFNACWN